MESLTLEKLEKLQKRLTKEQKIKLAIFAAESVLYIFEDKYPQDKRPRKAIEAAKNCFKDPSDKNKNATEAAAEAAEVASYTAYTAADKDYAAVDVAYTAADVAYNAIIYTGDVSAAFDAIGDAIAAAYNNKLKIEIIKYGFNLLRK